MHEEKNVKFYMHHGVEELRGENGKVCDCNLKCYILLRTLQIRSALSLDVRRNVWFSLSGREPNRCRSKGGACSAVFVLVPLTGHHFVAFSQKCHPTVSDFTASGYCIYIKLSTV